MDVLHDPDELSVKYIYDEAGSDHLLSGDCTNRKNQIFFTYISKMLKMIIYHFSSDFVMKVLPLFITKMSV